MQLTKKQEEGLRIAVQRYRDREKYTVISGYAGAGKSTLVKFIIEALQVDPDQVVYTSFTGKACQVLQKKGNKNVCTLHKLLYESIPKPDGTFFRKIREFIEYDIVVVDEVSMAPKELMDVLFNFPVYVICLGDPFQLPPVDKNADNHLLDHPHIFLNEIMRQAEESEIIRLSMAIREGKIIDYYKGKEVQILRRNELTTGMYEWADQILVATNDTRKRINSEMRTLLGKSGDPQDGDKVICLRNYWEKFSDNDNPLVNGTIGTIHNTFSSFVTFPPTIRDLEHRKIDVLIAQFVSDSNEDYGILDMDKQMIITGNGVLDWKEKYQIGKNDLTKSLIPYEFTYGYAITGHKAQGSEWDKVLVIEEKFPFDKEEHARWLYTCVTRASEKLVLIR